MLNLPISVGSVPVRALSEKLTLRRFSKSPILVGIEPIKALSFNQKISRNLSLDISTGKLPDSEFSSKSSRSSLVNKPSSEGNVPLILLLPSTRRTQVVANRCQSKTYPHTSLWTHTSNLLSWSSITEPVSSSQ